MKHPMNRNLLIVALMLFISFESSSQAYNASAPADTIILAPINFKKIVAYEIGNATILTDYDDFMKSFVPLWKKIGKTVRSLEKSKTESPWTVRRFNFLDAVYKRLTTEIKAQDTVTLTDMSFGFADIGTGYDFVHSVKEGRCIILDRNKVRQTFILRQKHSYQKAMLEGWGGWLYFISGQKQAFLRETEWVS